MPLFNSLGSNYSLFFTLTSIWEAIKLPFDYHPKTSTLLKSQLGEYYPGFIRLHYKGRYALTSALKSFGIGNGDQVITQAFTCWAVEESILAAGAKPIFADLAPNYLNPSLSTIQKVATKKTKALILQHTLGYPVKNLTKIITWCHNNDIVVIQDLAHSFGATNKLGDPIGRACDAQVFSFGRDKILDSVSGGACTLSNPISTNQPFPPNNLNLSDLFYPFLTFLIRTTYPIYLGRLIHRLAKSIKLISSPIKNSGDPSHTLSPAHSHLALNMIRNIKLQLDHRYKIAKIYHRHLGDINPLQVKPSVHFTHLRYPISVSSRHSLLKTLKSHGYHLSDIWYRQPVETGRTQIKSSYQSGSCPTAEVLASNIINLPTHIHTSPEDARHISSIVKSHLKNS